MWWMAAALGGDGPAEVGAVDLGGGTAPTPVVGGTVVQDGDWEDTAGIVFNGSYVGCTGTLIAPDLVITAGHCAGGITHVVVGTNDWTRGGEWIDVDRTREYPNSWNTYDVSILELEEPSSVTPRAVAMDCVLEEYLDDDADVSIVGYGATNAAGTIYPDELHEAVTTVSDADCSQDRIDGFWSGCNTSVRPGGEIAAGGDGVDTCFGDSGGPLYLLTPIGDFLVGVTSRGYLDVPYSQPCYYGGIYVRPDAVVDWIEEETGRTVTKPVCNHRPEPVADAIVVAPGEVGTTVVDANDPDPTGEVTYTVVDPPAHGKVEVDVDGTVTYEADADWSGEDAVVIEVDDGGNPDWPRTGTPLSEEVTIAITVTGRSGGGGGGDEPASLDLDGDGVPDDGSDGYMRMGCGCASGGAAASGWLAVGFLLSWPVVGRARRR